MNESVNESMNQSIDESINLSINQFSHWYINSSILVQNFINFIKTSVIHLIMNLFIAVRLPMNFTLPEQYFKMCKTTAYSTLKNIPITKLEGQGIYHNKTMPDLYNIRHFQYSQYYKNTRMTQEC